MVIRRVADADETHRILDEALTRSEDQLKVMRDVAREVIGENSNVIVGVNGSIARREMTSGSDVDLFFLTLGDTGQQALDIKDAYRSRLIDLEIKMPAQDGVFDAVLSVDELLSNIGGDDDTNKFLTRRMLYLLEGEWVFNHTEFESLRARLIDHYVAENLEDHKFCQYLLNDIIRYWRTICVDFEQKTAKGEKARAIRLIKLRFARMMLYFGGVAAIAQTGDIPAAEKQAKLLEMFSLHPAARLRAVFGEKDVMPALSSYATFLSALDDKSIRAALDSDGYSGLETDEYKELVEVARDFRDGLKGLLVDASGLRNKVASALLL